MTRQEANRAREYLRSSYRCDRVGALDIGISFSDIRASPVYIPVFVFRSTHFGNKLRTFVSGWCSPLADGLRRSSYNFSREPTHLTEAKREISFKLAHPAVNVKRLLSERRQRAVTRSLTDEDICNHFSSSNPTVDGIIDYLLTYGSSA